MANGTRQPIGGPVVGRERERLIAALYEPIEQIVRAGDRVITAWARRDLKMLELRVAELRARHDAYLAEMEGRL